MRVEVLCDETSDTRDVGVGLGRLGSSDFVPANYEDDVHGMGFLAPVETVTRVAEPEDRARDACPTKRGQGGQC